MYDARTAPIYDLLYVGGDTPLRDGRREADHILGLIREQSPSARSLLDIGCGTGRYLEFLEPHVVIDGIDINASFLEVAQRRCPSGSFHVADMEHFDLGRRFDVITCLFSSIAYVATAERLARTVAGFARHLNAGGLIVIEPWFTPETFWDGHVSANYVDRPEVKVAWMHRQTRQGRISMLDIHYLIASEDDVTHHSERHELGLFTDAEYRGAMEDLGLRVSHDPQGFGRGLYVGTIDGVVSADRADPHSAL